MTKKIFVMATMASGLLAGIARAQKPPLLPEKDVAALANELSGETAKRNLEVIATFHRQRGSSGFHSAAELVAERLRAYGLSEVAILQFPADGKIFFNDILHGMTTNVTSQAESMETASGKSQ